MAIRLTRRQLNRTLLQRQMLLERAELSALEATRALVALQAQVPDPPYIGLWTRLKSVERDDLTRLMEDRQIVRAAWLRSTLHLTTADDQRAFIYTLLPAIERAHRAFNGKQARELDNDQIVAVARPFLEEASRSTGDLRKRLKEAFPDYDDFAMASAARTYLPLVQVPPAGTWGSGSRSSYVTAENWIGGATHDDNLRDLIHRYLSAFGPASLMDFQAWTGLTKLKPRLDELREGLTTYIDESDTALFDLPGLTIMDGDTPAPVRLIPQYDNLVLSHANRTRIIADEHRGYVFLSAARVIATVLIDGFVAGTWTLDRSKKTQTTLRITTFGEINAATTQALESEAESVLAFADYGGQPQVVFEQVS